MILVDVRLSKTQIHPVDPRLPLQPTSGSLVVAAPPPITSGAATIKIHSKELGPSATSRVVALLRPTNQARRHVNIPSGMQYSRWRHGYLRNIQLKNMKETPLRLLSAPDVLHSKSKIGPIRFLQHRLCFCPNYRVEQIHAAANITKDPRAIINFVQGLSCFLIQENQSRFSICNTIHNKRRILY